MKTFIYVEHSGLGNMVMATPFLRQLKKCYPDSRTIVCCWDRSIGAIQHLGYVDSAVTMHPVQVLNSFQTFSSGAPVAFISPVGAIWEDHWGEMCSHIIKAPIKTPYTKHESLCKLDLLKNYLLVEPSNFSPLHLLPDFHIKYSPPERLEILNRAGLSMSDYIVINASFLRHDHWSLKHWGNKNYSQLIGLLRDSYRDLGLSINKFVLVGTAADVKDANDIISNCPYPNLAINLCGRTSIQEVATILGSARLVVGNDSGLAHISSALGTRTYTIFTFTSTIKNRPMGEGSTIIAKPCDERLGCQHGHYNSCKHKKCFDISPEEVCEIIIGEKNATQKEA